MCCRLCSHTNEDRTRNKHTRSWSVAMNCPSKFRQRFGLRQMKRQLRNCTRPSLKLEESIILDHSRFPYQTGFCVWRLLSRVHLCTRDHLLWAIVCSCPFNCLCMVSHHTEYDQLVLFTSVVPWPQCEAAFSYRIKQSQTASTCGRFRVHENVHTYFSSVGSTSAACEFSLT